MSYVVDPQSGNVVAKYFDKGINNRSADSDVPAGALRNAVNIDIDGAGILSRRDGYEKIVSAFSTHSGWSCDTRVLYVSAGVLKILNSDNTSTDVCNVVGEVCYHYENGIVYFSDEVQARKLYADGHISNWGVMPLPVPGVVARTGASVLAPGEYLVTITPTSLDGSEHGASDVSRITVLSGQYIEVVFPAASDPQIAYFRTYVSTVNGEILYAVADSAVGTSSISVISVTGTKELDTLGVEAMPPCSAITSYNGVMYGVSGSTVWHTEPFSPDRVRVATGYFQFPAQVNVIAGATAGVWVAADKTYHLRGGSPKSFVLEVAAEYGAPKGNAYKIKNVDKFVWYSDRGLVIAGDTLDNIQEKNVATETGTSAAVVVRENDGIIQTIASVRNAVVSPLVSKSFLEMEVIRKAG